MQNLYIQHYLINNSMDLWIIHMYICHIIYYGIRYSKHMISVISSVTNKFSLSLTEHMYSNNGVCFVQIDIQ